MTASYDHQAQRWLFSIDPGPKVSSWVWFGGWADFVFGDTLYTGPYVNKVGKDEPHSVICDHLRRIAKGARDIGYSAEAACEDFEGMGRPLGAESVWTIRWSGRYQQVAEDVGLKFSFVKRTAVKLHLCGNRNAKEAGVNRALLDRFGPIPHDAKGTKADPGPIYGVSSHAWSALAVAVTFYDVQQVGEPVEAAEPTPLS